MITSPSNELIKKAVGLKQKKYREIQGAFLAEGLKLVVDCLLFRKELFRHILVSEKGLLQLESEYKSKTGDEFAFSHLVQTVDEKLLQRLSDTVQTQNVFAIIDLLPTAPPHDFVLFLDRIRDPGNLGTIVRTAAAAGYSLILNDCADIFSPKVVRASMSGILNVNFLFENESYIDKMKNEGYFVVAADAKGQNLFSQPKATKILIVIGNEAEGISQSILQKCDILSAIPMENMESLNAAVSAAIMMYHYKMF